MVKRNSDASHFKFIKKIINEAIPSKSKWANDERVGQEQLYEALEKVLSKLKNYTVCIPNTGSFYSIFETSSEARCAKLL
jgi:hypothetical protein